MPSFFSNSKDLLPSIAAIESWLGSFDTDTEPLPLHEIHKVNIAVIIKSICFIAYLLSAIVS